MLSQQLYIRMYASFTFFKYFIGLKLLVGDLTDIYCVKCFLSVTLKNRNRKFSCNSMLTSDNFLYEINNTYCLKEQASLKLVCTEEENNFGTDISGCKSCTD
jgi:hypothetical protein